MKEEASVLNTLKEVDEAAAHKIDDSMSNDKPGNSIISAVQHEE